MDKTEKLRYSRLSMLEGIGEQGVRQLSEGKVFIVGAGALGSLCAMYLAASGVGTIGIADFDTIDLSNLQRQLFYGESSLGKSKIEILTQHINEINSTVKVNAFFQIIKEASAIKIFPDYDFIIDGSDNPSTKKLTAETCEKAGIPYCIGGVRQFGGQVMSWDKGHMGYLDLFGDIPLCSGFTPCSLGGVLGPAAGVVASIQSAEAIKHLTGAGQMLYDKIFTFDLFNNTSSIFSL